MSDNSIPTMENRPAMVSSCHEEVEALSLRCGITQQPWQHHVNSSGIYGERVDGSWAASEVAEVVPRQNGKGTTGESRVLAGIGLFEEQLIFWTSHQVPTALEARDRILWAVNNCDELRREVKKVVNVNGRESIEFFGLSKSSRITEPRRVRFAARTSHAGRGFAGADVIFYDETYDLTPNQHASSLPTTSTKANTQIFYLSSPPLDIPQGGPKRKRDELPGMVLFQLRKRAKAGDDRLYYAEWSLEHDLEEVEARDPDTGKHVIDLYDTKLIRRLNPAYGLLLTKDSIEREKRTFSRRGFARERLGSWPIEPRDDSAPENRIFSPEVWSSRHCELSEHASDSIVLGVDSSPSRSASSIVAFWADAEGKEFAELVDYREGVEWLPGRLRELANKHNPVAIALDKRSHAGGKLPALKSLNFRTVDEEPGKEARHGTLWVAATADVAAATTDLIEAVNAGRVWHGGQPELTLGIANVALRSIGEGMQAFARLVSVCDISSVVALSLARRAWQERVHLARKANPFACVW